MRKVIGVVSTLRHRNPRGSGDLLRDEILAAASALLDAADSESELTLRRIAGAAGITAPAIYPHFPDRAAILSAMAERAWHDVVDEIRTAVAEGLTPRARLHQGCATYVAFAQRHPLRYAMMTRAASPTPAAREALGVVTRGLAACRVDPNPPVPLALARLSATLSTALHGVAMLNRTDAPSMWLADISPADVIRTLVDSAVDQLNRAEENM